MSCLANFYQNVKILLSRTLTALTIWWDEYAPTINKPATVVRDCNRDDSGSRLCLAWSMGPVLRSHRSNVCANVVNQWLFDFLSSPRVATWKRHVASISHGYRVCTSYFRKLWLFTAQLSAALWYEELTVSKCFLSAIIFSVLIKLCFNNDYGHRCSYKRSRLIIAAFLGAVLIVNIKVGSPHPRY